jgi:1,4-dihydroxy-2-naphthoate octaprenyltransferase
MVKNIGSQDQKIRYIAGALLILAALFLKSWILGIIGLIAIGTAYTGTCLAYIPMNINTKEGEGK